MLSKHVGAVKSVLKKRFKINDIQLVHLLVVRYLVNLQDARCNNKAYCPYVSRNICCSPNCVCVYIYIYIYTKQTIHRTTQQFRTTQQLRVRTVPRLG